jgi:hypothetical protein
MLVRIGSKVTVKRLLKFIAAPRGNTTSPSSVLEALACIAQASPTTIPLMIERGILPLVTQKLQSTSASDLALALKLVHALLPPVQRTGEFEHLDPDEHEAALGEMRDAGNDGAPLPTPTPVSQLSSMVREHAADGEGGDFWSCSMCTLLNPPTAMACEVCGNVCPQISELGGAQTSSPSLHRPLTPLDETELALTCQTVFASRPELLVDMHRSLSPSLAVLVTSAASSSDRARALSCLVSLFFYIPRDELSDFFISTGGASGQGHLSAGLHSHSGRVVSRVLQLCLVILWRLGKPVAKAFAKQGIPQLVRRLGARARSSCYAGARPCCLICSTSTCLRTTAETRLGCLSKS